jgi:hypothetical protein
MNKPDSGISLIELIIAVILVTVVILGIMSIDNFGRYHLITSDRRARLQSEVSYTLEHMHKYIVQGSGNSMYPPIERLAANNGFRVRVDRNNPATPSDLTDDTWVSYTLGSGASSNTLTCTLRNTTGPVISTEILATRVLAGVAYGIMPSPAVSGFNINITDPGPNGSAVEIGLVSRWDPANASSSDNPQVEMKTKILAASASAH